MRYNTMWILTVALTGSGCANLEPEWHSQSTTIYQSVVYDFISTASPFDTQIDMIGRQLNAGDNVDLEVNDWSECDDYTLRLQMGGVNTSNFVCRLVPHSDLWSRDTSPVSVTVNMDSDDPLGDLLARGLTLRQAKIVLKRYAHLAGYSGEAFINWVFDGWGYGPFTPDDVVAETYDIDDDIVPELSLQLGIPMVSSPLIFEGGNIDTNGLGTYLYSSIATDQRQMYHPTGPNGRPMSSADIHDELVGTFTSPHVIGVPYRHPLDVHSVIDGPLAMVNPDGSTTYIHVPFTVSHGDEAWRFVNENTILVAQLPPEYVHNNIDAMISYELSGLKSFLAEQVDQDGNPFNIVDFPDPGLSTKELTSDDNMWFYLSDFMEPQYRDLNGDGTLEELPTIQHYDPDGGTMASAATYINFVITNHLVMVAKFDDERDDEAVRILGDMFPDKTVEQFDTTSFAYGGGGMHCITMQRADLNEELMAAE